MQITLTETPGPVDAVPVTRRTAPRLPLDVSAAAYLEHLHEEIERLRPIADLAADRGRRIAAALGLIDRFDVASGAGWTAVLLADLRTVLGSFRDPAGGGS